MEKELLEKKKVEFYQKGSTFIEKKGSGYSINIPVGKDLTLSSIFSMLCEFSSEMSDIKIETTKKMWVKIDGGFKPLAVTDDISEEIMECIVSAILQISSSEEEIENYLNGKMDFDLAFRHVGINSKNEPVSGRFRILATKCYNGWSIIFRLINNKLPNVNDLEIPQIVFDVLARGNGMILVAGPPGSGKSTTLETLLQYVLDTYPVNVLSLEDPIEYIFKDNIGTITQREIGADVVSFGQGAKSSLRQSINILHITELRDADAIRIGIQAAENNIMVMSSIHSNSIADTTERMLTAFHSEGEKKSIAKLLSNQITLLLNQRLVVCKKVKGIVQKDGFAYPEYETEIINGKEVPKVFRKAVYEVISSSPKIRDAIRKQDVSTMMDSIYDEVRGDTKGEKGLKLLDRELVKLLIKGEITIPEVIKASYDKENLYRELEFGGIDIGDESIAEFFRDVAKKQ